MLFRSLKGTLRGRPVALEFDHGLNQFLGVAELLYLPETPPKVVIDEAVELAKRFSTDDSPRFVNGVLSAIVPTLRPS